MPTIRSGTRTSQGRGGPKLEAMRILPLVPALSVEAGASVEVMAAVVASARAPLLHLKKTKNSIVKTATLPKIVTPHHLRLGRAEGLVEDSNVIEPETNTD